jgi:hypothetical protein
MVGVLAAQARYFNAHAASCELFRRTPPPEANPRDANEFVGHPG